LIREKEPKTLKEAQEMEIKIEKNLVALGKNENAQSIKSIKF
jgi:hypothetical protein